MDSLSSHHQPRQPADGLVFINMGSHPEIKDESIHKLVRAHVMRKYKRDKRKQQQQQQQQTQQEKRQTSVSSTSSQSENFSNSDTGSGPQSATLCRSKAATKQLSESKDGSPETVEFPGEWNINFNTTTDHNPFSSSPPVLHARLSSPFEDLPIPVSPRLLMLLNHSVSSSLRTSVHADPTGTYRSYCIRNPAWTFMTISYSAARLEVLKQGDNRESAYYLSRSRAAINEIIATSPSDIDDSTIATVACLTNIACLHGSASDALVHIDGLQRMVELRGGLKNLGLFGIIRRMVQWSDLLCSASFKTKPRFPRWEFANMPHLSAFSPKKSSGLYNISFSSVLKDTAILSNQTETLNVLEELHGLTTFLNLSSTNELPFEAAYPDHLYSVEHKVLCLISEDEQESTMNMTHRLRQHEITELLLQVSLLYIYTNLRQTPIGGKLRRRLVRRLQQQLLDSSCTNLPLLMATFPAEMLWISFIGASASTGTDYQPYFNDLLHSLCRENGLVCWDQVSGFLQSLPVLENSCLRACKAIWMENSGASYGLQI